jgi:putative transposase
MGRPLRVEVPAGAYHLTSRGSNRQPIYYSRDERQLFLKLLGVAVAKHAWTLLAYCLMTNHYHLVVRIGDGELSSGMQWLNSCFSRITNKQQGREAHLFRNRFASRLIESDAHLLAACRYVVLNPVAAGICGCPEQWEWSSYRATAGLERPPAFLTDLDLLEWFAPSTDEARRRYRDFVEEGVSALAASTSVSDTVSVVST